MQGVSQLCEPDCHRMKTANKRSETLIYIRRLLGQPVAGARCLDCCGSDPEIVTDVRCLVSLLDRSKFVFGLNILYKIDFILNMY